MGFVCMYVWYVDRSTELELKTEFNSYLKPFRMAGLLNIRSRKILFYFLITNDNDDSLFDNFSR